MQMECSCGRFCDSLLMVRVWFPGQDDATDELVCPECAREYASLKSSNPFEEEEVVAMSCGTTMEAEKGG
jgi:hypothetical protein